MPEDVETKLANLEKTAGVISESCASSKNPRSARSANSKLLFFRERPSQRAQIFAIFENSSNHQKPLPEGHENYFFASNRLLALEIPGYHKTAFQLIHFSFNKSGSGPL